MPESITPGPSFEQATELPRRRSAWRWLWRLLVLLFAIFLLVTGTVLYVYQQHLKPQLSEDGEWTYTLHIRSVNIPISIPRAIVWGTSTSIGPWLTGLSRQTPWGLVRLGWDKSTQSLQVTCKDCSFQRESISPVPLTIKQIQISIHQDAPDHFSGLITLGQPGTATPPINVPWQGRLQANALQVDINVSNASITSIFQTLAPQLEEVKRARMTGTLSLNAQVTLPRFAMHISDLKVDDFTVSGLGTEKLLYASSACGPASELPMSSWMVQSVISAEDQRFERHPGYDLEELMAAIDANQEKGAVVRGGSTITQQTAKLLFTGSDRTLTRKLREILYAVEMEQTLGKARIMQLYLDNVPLGIYDNGRILCGAQTAAQHYFNVNADKLKPEQAVWLAAMLHSPVAEARSWQRTGRINLTRAIWIAEHVRNAPNSGPRARQKVVNTLRRDPSLGVKIRTLTP